MTVRMPEKYPLPPVKPDAERFVVEAFVVVRLVMNADASVAPDAERLVVEAFASIACVMVVVAKVDVPVTTSAPEVEVAEVIAPVNVLSPAKVWVVVDMKPRAVAEASGMMKVCTPAREEMVKSFAPVEDAAKVCTLSPNPLRSKSPVPPVPESTTMTLPDASTESALPFAVDVADAEEILVKRNPPTVVVALDVMLVALRVPMNA